MVIFCRSMDEFLRRLIGLRTGKRILRIGFEHGPYLQKITLGASKPGVLRKFRPRLLFLSGPSGVGKGTVIKFLRRNHGFSCLKRDTTKPLSAEERRSGQYRHVSEAAFLKMMAAGKYVGQPRKRYGYWRGLRRTTLLKALKGGRWLLEGSARTPLDLLTDADPRIAEARLISIFLLPTSLEQLEARLRGRRRETEREIKERLRMAKEHLQEAINCEDGHPPLMTIFIVNAKSRQTAKVIARFF